MGKQPKIKADDFVKFEGDKGEELEEKWTYFEKVEADVKKLIEVVNKQTDILRENNLTVKKEEVAEYFDEDDVYEELGEDEEE